MEGKDLKIEKIQTETINKIGWEHYERRWELQWSQWKEFHIWRFCHDDKHENNITNLEKNHKIDRHNIKKIKCIEWEEIQEPSKEWKLWGISFAVYCCLKWNLYDDKGLDK